MLDPKKLTPRQIVEELDKYIVGQNDAKRNVAIALRNRWRRMNASAEMRNEIIPNNILMIGATGVGKTEIARRLAKIADAPFVKVEASKFNLNYIKLDGTVGCMVNGAGLAMATMDIIKLAGGSPANFLDVGGGASAEQVKNAFRILMSDAAVKGVFINIFGGILRCDVLASGVVAAARELGITVPVVIRMEGTNVEEGKRILKESKLNFTIAEGMKDGAEKIVALARKAGAAR